MATVFRRDGYSFNIYRRDNPPAHVHVKREGKEAIIGLLAPYALIENWGFDENELAEIMAIVERRGAEFVRGYWDKYHLER